MPALHDATNTLQRWRVDSASHRVADLQSTHDRCRAFNIRVGCCRVGILDRVKGLLPNV
jgi:hypothetical protein